MGQAKLRGTYEERVLEAVFRNETAVKRAEEKEAARLAAAKQKVIIADGIKGLEDQLVNKLKAEQIFKNEHNNPVGGD